MSIPPYAMEINGLKTLPLYSMVGRTLEEIPRLGSGKVRFEYEEPKLEPSPFSCDQECLERVSRDYDYAMSAMKKWQQFIGRYIYFVQFKDDPTRTLVIALSDHTELLSRICDLRLNLDPTPLLRTFHGAHHFGIVQCEYRKDPDREGKYGKYAQELDEAHERYIEHYQNAHALTARMQRIMETQRAEWPALPSLDTSQPSATPTAELQVFCSYSHKDESLRNQLHAHLSLLIRDGTISFWHDRKITAGQEWKGEISRNLDASQIILLLISANFIHSDYCFDVELARAMERHTQRLSRVVPVILRDCDWQSASFGALQALPTGGRPITRWKSRDQAFADVAKGLRDVTAEIKSG